MSIFPQTAALLLKEHRHRPISGEVLTIGRQTVLLTDEEAVRLIQSEGVELRADYLHETDTETIGSDVRNYITDLAFFSMFCDARVRSLDVSDYEGSEIIHDLNASLPSELHNIADFIFNGSCLDNLFDPARAIRSLSQMLRPGGRIIHLEHGSPIQDALLCYSPAWFFDFYAINDYTDCQIFVCTFKESLQRDWRVDRWLPFHQKDGKIQPSATSLWVGDFVNIVVAERGTNSNDNRTPIQSHYRVLQNDPTQDVYRLHHDAFCQTTRRYALEPWSKQSRRNRADLVPMGVLHGSRSGLSGLHLVWRVRSAWRALTA